MQDISGQPISDFARGLAIRVSRTSVMSFTDCMGTIKFLRLALGEDLTEEQVEFLLRNPEAIGCCLLR